MLFFVNEMHLCHFTNAFDLTKLFAKINAFVLCTDAFATEAYHFKANVLAVFISCAATVSMFSGNHKITGLLTEIGKRFRIGSLGNC